MSHIPLALLIQAAIWLAMGDLWAGAMTQAEYRWIERNGGFRAAMPWWKGLDVRLWDAHSRGDVALPALAVLGVAQLDALDMLATLAGGAVLAIWLMAKKNQMNVIFSALLTLDRVLNVLLGGSFSETLSARAHRMRVKPQPYWYWLADAIDAVFFWQPDHCRKQFEFEQAQKATKAGAEVASGGKL
jgi:hypothetical protein